MKCTSAVMASNPVFSSMYSIEEPNKIVTIRDVEPVELLCGETSVKTTAVVKIRWLPKPRLLIECEFKGMHVPKPNHGDQYVIEFPSIGVSTSVDWINRTYNSSSGTTLTLVPKNGLIERQQESDLSRTTFHLVNFSNSPMLRGGGIELEAGGWQIKIDPVPNLKNRTDELKRSGGYAITHAGEIQYGDNREFAQGDAIELLTALNNFFSFVQGFWVPPLLPVGYSSNNSVIWEQWGVRRTDPWQSVPSWFNGLHEDPISTLFPGFWSRWNNELWQKAIESAVYWYVRSNTQGSGTDGSIILTQAALELLSWTTYVEANGGLSKEGFKKLSAADQLRLLLSRTGIPLGVPEELQGLSKLAKQFNWDGANAFVNLRNSLVHPGHSREDDFSGGKAIFEGWLLGMWYLELILLKLFNYDGVYLNRLKLGGWVGDVEDVPWSNSI
ncbi:hypothetical protein BH24ACT22_BH24ACT22_01960 [soil metagenome]